MYTTAFITLGLLAATQATSIDNTPRDECKPCNPQGATSASAPSFGPDLKNMYIDVLSSVKDIHFRKRDADGSSLLERRNGALPRAASFCCREELDCVNIQNLNIAMCYDKFTTNYQLPDGSYGSLTTGDLTSGGSKANLLTGQYSKGDGGESGNIYAGDAAAAKPNTVTLSIPPQFTGTGVGGAVPASQIGSVIAPSSSGAAGQATTTPAGSMSTGGASSSARGSGSQSTPAASQSAASSSQGAAGGSPSSAGGASGPSALGSTTSVGLTIVTGLIYLFHAF